MPGRSEVTAKRIALRLLGLQIVDLHLSTDDEQACEEIASDDPGDCTTYPVGFSAPDPAPYEMDCPDRG